MVATAISCWTEKLFNKDSNTQTLQKRWGLFYAITSFYCVFAKIAIHLSIAQLDPLHGYQRSLFLPKCSFSTNDKTTIIGLGTDQGVCVGRIWSVHRHGDTQCQ